MYKYIFSYDRYFVVIEIEMFRECYENVPEMFQK